jgi:hypothetical protein
MDVAIVIECGPPEGSVAQTIHHLAPPGEMAERALLETPYGSIPLVSRATEQHCLDAHRR